MSYSVSHGQAPSIITVSNLSIRETVRVARDLEARGIRPRITDSDGKIMDLYFLERALGDDFGNRT